MATFKTRARAVDMLGRQQIAGIPTAISELFKNAHDAYADHAEVDFYRSDDLFVLRDDGLGMTEAEFLDRWLVIGTESKLGAPGMDRPAIDSSKPQRPILGEKGIGRLAIGVIGPQVLVLTRAKRGNTLHDLVVAFIHWGLFALPGVNLEDITIPLLTFPSGTLPNRADVRTLVNEAQENLGLLRKFADDSTATRIERELASFDVDPIQLDAELGAPRLSGHGHGTHFIISPADDSLAADIDKSDDTDGAAPLLKTLIGFTNTMTPGHSSPQIVTAFRDHRTPESSSDLISEGEFFTADEFGRADHHIRGRFDAFGQFNGTVAVYQQPAVEHVVPWSAAQGLETDCGPFDISLAVVQGESKATLVAPDEYQRLVRKMNKIGGLYIYKDGVRVLPYGNTDYDFLNIERNRTKSAYYYYFSYRRIFGVIQINSRENAALSEKAGREGFRESRAYRQFRDILSNFFVQTAADFFREEGAHADSFYRTKGELDRLQKAKLHREQQVTQRKKVFAKDVESRLELFASGAPVKRVAEIMESLKRQASGAETLKDQGQAASELLRVEMSARKALQELERELSLKRARGFALSIGLSRDWEALANELRRFSTDCLQPAEEELNRIVTAAAQNAKTSLDRRRRLEEALAASIEKASRTTRSESQDAQRAAADVSSRVGELTSEAIKTVDAVVKNTQTELARLDVTSLSEREFLEKRRHLEDLLTSAAAEQQRILSSVAEQLRSISSVRDATGGVVTGSDVAESLEEEVEALRERSLADLELAQLGMAIEVINHEFEGSIKAIRGSLRRLRTWAAKNPRLGEVYASIRASFEHLDGYLSLFTPLHRRLYRQEIDITGSAIKKFLEELFSERLRRHNVRLEATDAFLQHTIRGYPSTFYPVFVNLVDNALFWVKERREPRIITLERDQKALIVSDSGPGVSRRDREAIFDLGFSRKPGGRGLGLHISREALSRAGYQLTIDDTPKGQGASFRISPKAPGTPL
jgi:signal transduction histidine kinase